jgi:hypothetical protein
MSDLGRMVTRAHSVGGQAAAKDAAAQESARAHPSSEGGRGEGPGATSDPARTASGPLHEGGNGNAAHGPRGPDSAPTPIAGVGPGPSLGRLGRHAASGSDSDTASGRDRLAGGDADRPPIVTRV